MAPGGQSHGAALLLSAVVAIAAVVAAAAAASPRRYATSAKRYPAAPLNVHLVCHSHDDAGWLKTVDQYFWGANNTIQVAGVQYILDTVMQALLANPDRKFVYGEMSFFMRWWDQQDDDTRAAVAQLVKQGQLDFVNGGYVQHDEATAHYVAMIDQTTRGHEFLRRTFGVAPRVGWQIDPFGHSSTQAGLLSAQVGFDALFFGRADYQDMEKRRSERALEVVWRGSGSLADADVFTGNFPSGNYGPPPGFAFEWADPPLMDDPRLEGYNVEERVDAFVERCRELANVTAGNDIMLTIGSDFQFANAHLQFKNLDKLIHHVNADGRLHAFYSTPAEYAAAKHSYGARWPLKTDDFFPYADNPHAFWTGYFTSRPASKGFIRAATSYLQAARQLEAAVGLPERGPNTESLEEAVSLLQHHDGITGTAKQHVVNDYHRRVHAGLKEAQAVVASALERLIRGATVGGTAGGTTGPAAGGGSAAPAARRLAMAQEGPAGLHAVQHAGREAAAEQEERVDPTGSGGGNPIDSPIPLESCDWLNITACNATVHLSSRGQGMLVAAYNPLAWSRETVVRVPVSTAVTCMWKASGPEGEDLPVQLLPVPNTTLALQQLMAAVNATCPTTFGDAELAFVAQLPPLGYATFFLEPQSGAAARAGSSSDDGSSREQKQEAGQSATQAADAREAAAEAAEVAAEEEEVQQGWLENEEKNEHTAVLDSGLVRLEFDTRTGLLRSVHGGGASARLAPTFAWYNSSDGLDSDENRGQGSGAYVFRPNGRYDLSATHETSAAPGWRSLWERLWGGGGGGGGRVPAGAGPVARLEIVEGVNVWEARQTFADWATLVTRLHRGQAAVEVEWTVGPIPIDDGLGKEVVLVYDSDLGSGAQFWSDSNGREMLRRVRDFRPTWELNQTEPAAGNYYPLTAAMYLLEGGDAGGAAAEGARQLAVLTDRAQGGASLRSGQMEVMLHRRTLRDDLRGVDEALNETACGCRNCDCPGLVARGRHWLLLAPAREAARPRRTAQQELNDPPVLAFGPIPRQIGASSDPGGRVGLRRTWTLSEGHILHSNVHLLTLKDTGSSYLVRLAHLYQAGEDPSLSKPITEDLNSLLQLLHFNAIRELSLSGNQLRSDMQQRRLRFQPGDSLSNDSAAESAAAGTAAAAGGTAAAPVTAAASGGALGGGASGAEDAAELAKLRAGAEIFDCSSGCRNAELLVTLAPMEVRTFELIYRPM